MLYRENYIQKIAGFKDMDVIKVITGLRRSGKSTIMRQVQEYYEKTGISPNQILYYNFESYEYIDLLDDKKLYMHIKNEVQHAAICS
jgi:predicted AAA+ superfamily ATPase